MDEFPVLRVFRILLWIAAGFGLLFALCGFVSLIGIVSYFDGWEGGPILCLFGLALTLVSGVVAEMIALLLRLAYDVGHTSAALARTNHLLEAILAAQREQTAGDKRTTLASQPPIQPSDP